ncbi:MAG: hypothetical protein VB110_10665 [Bacteroidales bacterium]|nr:hypothetical protein [Bacteroidales bacterium]
MLVVENGAGNDLYYQNKGSGVFTLTTSLITDWGSSKNVQWVTGDFTNNA